MSWRVGEYCTFTGITYTTEEFNMEQQAVERAKMICRRYQPRETNGIGATVKPDGSRIFLAQGAHYGARLWEFDFGSPLQTEHLQRENAELSELRGEASDLAGVPYMSQSDLRPVSGPVPGTPVLEVPDRKAETCVAPPLACDQCAKQKTADCGFPTSAFDSAAVCESFISKGRG